MERSDRKKARGRAMVLFEFHGVIQVWESRRDSIPVHCANLVAKGARKRMRCFSGKEGSGQERIRLMLVFRRYVFRRTSTYGKHVIGVLRDPGVI